MDSKPFLSVPPAVEDVAGEAEEQVLGSEPSALTRPRIHRSVRREDEGEEEEEGGGVEEHGSKIETADR